MEFINSGLIADDNTGGGTTFDDKEEYFDNNNLGHDEGGGDYQDNDEAGFKEEECQGEDPPDESLNDNGEKGDDGDANNEVAKDGDLNDDSVNIESDGNALFPTSGMLFTASDNMSQEEEPNQSCPSGNHQPPLQPIPNIHKHRNNACPAVYISYHSSIRAQILPLHDCLEELGFRCWIDVERIGDGDNHKHALLKGIRDCTVVLSCLSQQYEYDENCRREITLANIHKKTIIPLMIEKIDWPVKGTMKIILTPLRYMECWDPCGNGWRDPVDRSKFVPQQLIDQLCGELHIGHRPNIFISYEEEVEEEARCLYERLTDLGFTACWHDGGLVDDEDGSRRKQALEGIKNCKVMLCCITPNYTLNEPCRQEVTIAHGCKKVIVPLMLKMTPWPVKGPLGFVLTPRVYIDCCKESQDTWINSEDPSKFAPQALLDQLCENLDMKVVNKIDASTSSYEADEYDDTDDLHQSTPTPTAVEVLTQVDGDKQPNLPRTRTTSESPEPQVPDNFHQTPRPVGEEKNYKPPSSTDEPDPKTKKKSGLCILV